MYYYIVVTTPIKIIWPNSYYMYICKTYIVCTFKPITFALSKYNYLKQKRKRNTRKYTKGAHEASLNQHFSMETYTP